MLKRVRVVSKFSCLFILLLMLAMAVSCAKKDAAQSADAGSGEIAVPVNVIVAGQGRSAGEIVATGVLEPVNETQVSCKQGGIIKSINVNVGDRVRRGQVLARLDDADYRLGVQQAEAAYQGALIAYQTMERDYQRLSGLVAEGAISTSEYDRATMGYKSAKYAVQQAEAGLNYARQRADDTVVRAPFNGQITMRLVSVGAYVDPMMKPVMFVLVDNSRLRLLLKLPEMRAALVKPGDEVEVRLPTDGRTFKTNIDVITDSVDAVAHTRTAVAWIKNTGDNPIPGGASFEARILSHALIGKMLLPSTAVRAEANGKFITYVVQKGKTIARELTGQFLPDQSEFVVESGLNGGEQVVVESSMVRDGQPVTVTGEAAGTAQGARE
jgi:membrane fusion protein (multidrug efflux system)